MAKHVNLLEGNITKAITKLAFPLMGMSFLQMTYSLTDIFWIGKLGAGEVAAVGTGGMLMWFCNGIHMLAQTGGQVLVAQNLGAKEFKTAGKFAHSAMFLSMLISLSLGLIFIVFINPIVGFFNLNDPQVIAYAKTYISITCGLLFFPLSAKLLTQLTTTTGNSRIPFIASICGLVFNMVIDPVLIFGWFGFPKLGVLGAGIATILAQAIVLGVLVFNSFHDKVLFCHIKLFSKPDFSFCKKILKLSFPTAAQNTVFPMVTMYIATLIAGFGDHAVAAQRVGSQIESISWNATEGFAVAVNNFIAQNYGARNIKRAREGFSKAVKIISIYGFFTSCLLIFGARPLFTFFLNDANALPIGIDYLVIMGFSQLFLCMEILCSNTLNAFGKTLPPAVITLSCVLLRVPIATYLCTTSLGLSGIWGTMATTSILKGTLSLIAVLIFMNYLKKIFPENTIDNAHSV